MKRVLWGLITLLTIVILAGVKPEFFQVQAQLPPNLPVPQAHPLPKQLATWKDQNATGDYFDQVKPLEVGYPIWSIFPLKVYIEPTDTTASTTNSQRWTRSVLQAVQEWNAYLPMQPVNDPQQADITFWRSALPIRFSQNPGRSGRGERVRSAETRFEVFVVQEQTTGRSYLRHRAAIRIRPNQTDKYLLAAARHELGHALGIWGHSTLQTDVMYYAQVRDPLPISARDLNTLKKIYQQPTQLGWPF